MSAASFSEPEGRTSLDTRAMDTAPWRGVDFRSPDRADCDLHDPAPGTVRFKPSISRCSPSTRLILLVLSVGQTFVIIAGGIDLSVGAVSSSPRSRPRKLCSASPARRAEPTARRRADGHRFRRTDRCACERSPLGRRQRRPCRRRAHPAAHRHARHLRHGAGLCANSHERHRHSGRPGAPRRRDRVRGHRRVPFLS